jgi:glycosyltransferase involved in cell wall biosynthesis
MQSDTVLLVTNIPNPYRIALFNRVSQRFKETGWRLVVLFGAATYSRRKYQLRETDFQFENITLKSTTFHFGNNEHTYFFYQGLCRSVFRLKPRVVITSGFNLATFKIALLSYFLPFKMIIWSGSILHKGRKVSYLRKLFRKWLIHRSNSFIVYGTQAGNYLKSLGAAPSDIFVAINTVDTRFFAEETFKKRQERTLKPPYHFCTVGYFSKRKNGIAILRVIKKLSEHNNSFILDIVGEGNDLANMKSFVQENHLSQHVIFHGYKQQHELPEFLAGSIGFLFQTDFDIWGLVLNEAMASGLPCLSSINAGATHDLIIHGKNGFAVRFDEVDTTASYLEFLLQHPEQAEAIGREASETIQRKATIEISAEGFINAVQKSVAS